MNGNDQNFEILAIFYFKNIMKANWRTDRLEKIIGLISFMKCIGITFITVKGVFCKIL